MTRAPSSGVADLVLAYLPAPCTRSTWRHGRMVEDGTGEPVWVLIEVTAVVLPGMVARRCGAIVSISSRDSSCNRQAAYGKLLCVATTPTFPGVEQEHRKRYDVEL
ncbi:hypothetical protein EJB05_15697, partial [Eragrostis curvula]